MLNIYTKKRNKSDSGFTLVEIIIVIAVLSVLLSFLFAALANLYMANTSLIKTTLQTTQTRKALDTIVSSVEFSNGLLPTKDIATKPLGSDNDTASWDWNDSRSSFHTALITQQPTTTGGIHNATRRLVINSDGPDGCNGNSPQFLYQTRIFFTRNGNLYQRNILPDESLVCNHTNIDQLQSCAESIRDSYPSICTSSDRLLLSNVTKFNIKYFKNAGDDTPMTITDATKNKVSTAKSILISLETTQQIDRHPNIVNVKARVNIRNI